MSVMQDLLRERYADISPHPTHLGLLKPIEHHSINDPKSDMQGFAP